MVAELDSVVELFRALDVVLLVKLVEIELEVVVVPSASSMNWPTLSSSSVLVFAQFELAVGAEFPRSLPPQVR